MISTVINVLNVKKKVIWNLYFVLFSVVEWTNPFVRKINSHKNRNLFCFIFPYHLTKLCLKWFHFILHNLQIKANESFYLFYICYTSYYLFFPFHFTSVTQSLKLCLIFAHFFFLSIFLLLHFCQYFSEMTGPILTRLGH